MMQLKRVCFHLTCNKFIVTWALLFLYSLYINVLIQNLVSVIQAVLKGVCFL